MFGIVVCVGYRNMQYHGIMVQCRHYFVYKWHFCDADFGMGNCKNALHNSSAKLCAV